MFPKERIDNERAKYLKEISLILITLAVKRVLESNVIENIDIDTQVMFSIVKPAKLLLREDLANV